MDPIYPCMVHSMSHHLTARWPWHSTSQAKLLLVCCRHPQSCHPRSSIMWKVSGCQDELCHHSYPTWHRTSKPCTCSHSNSSQAYCSPAAVKPIKSTDDLIKEFLDQFTGICRFPGEYTIWLHHDVHPIIHAPRKCPISYVQRSRNTLTKWNAWEWSPMGTRPWTGCHQSPTFWKQMVSYICV